MHAGMFLDRDGVINEVLSERVKFVNQPEDFYLLEGAGEAIRILNEKGYKVFVVTNQGGIGLGYMEEENLHAIHEKMREDLAAYEARVEEIAYCPHKPHDQCACRKPKPKMIEDLAEAYDIDLSRSYMVGDRKPDIEAGQAAGTKTVYVGRRKKEAQADLYYDDLLSFARDCPHVL
ncbi:D-glycero-beta-D-manno-heptose 1,7-bisphosphate 7-phosphatase [Salinibacillus aidingensis]|uniref:D,D-heptose 1,7-bisphosphate phosphatase n=1 Tax=Salinibacillus aidingensis TaxID=237684 RepID=A0ABN1BAX2_9BACI